MTPPRTAALGLRLSEELKKAIEKAAKDDRRSISAYVEMVLIEHLQDKLYLPPK